MAPSGFTTRSFIMFDGGTVLAFFSSKQYKLKGDLGGLPQKFFAIC